MGREEFGSYRSFIVLRNAIKVEMEITTPIHAWLWTVPVITGEAAVVTAKMTTDCINDFELGGFGYSCFSTAFWAFHAVRSCSALGMIR